MSSTAANPQHEPTMEEILASIRKIISEDQPDATKAVAQPEPAKPAVQPVPLRAVPAPAPEPVAAAPDLDVLELTEALPEEEPAAPVENVAAAANDLAFENVDPAPQPAADEAPDDLISDTTRTAVVRAFANMDNPGMPYVPSGGSIEAIFVQAVQSSFQPTLQHWVESHRSEIMEMMKPLIRAWMDEHLPPLIEAALAKEIGRAAATRKRQ